MSTKVRYLNLRLKEEKQCHFYNFARILKSFFSWCTISVHLKILGILSLASYFLWILFNLKPNNISHQLSVHNIFNPQRRTLFESTQKTQAILSRKILFWTSYYEKWTLGFKEFTCSENRRCEVTFNRNEFDQVDALVFSAVDLKTQKGDEGYSPKDLPKHRKKHIPWIIALFESPEHVLIDLRVFHGIFNWTWSYRKDADIPGTPLYERVENDIGDTVEKMKGPIPIENKNKVAAWIVSNCDLQPSNRNYLVKLLRKYISIDIYGNCGNKICSTASGMECYREISSNYKFYLSFENSLCKDYTTEKFPSALDAGMVPIVFNFGNITEPAGSFINVFDYETVKQLAEHLLFLHQNPQEYAKYFQWRKVYRRVKEQNFLCSVCDRLWKKPETGFEIKTVEFLWDWWVHSKNANGDKIWACRRPGYHFHNLRQLFTSWWEG